MNAEQPVVASRGCHLARTASSAVLVWAAAFLPNAAARADDFRLQCERPGIVRCYGFDDEDDVAKRILPPSGGTSACRNDRCWAIDRQTFASGTGALRFDVPSNSGADTSGSFFLNFADDVSVQFGEGETFYVQFKYRLSPEMIREFDGGGGFKVSIVGAGDKRPGCRYGAWDAESCAGSCTATESVITTDNRYLGPSWYHSCGRWLSMQFSDGRQLRLQHQGPPYCYYPDDPERGCLRWVAHEWLTIRYRIQVGTWDEPTSRIKVWFGREGRRPDMIYDSTNSHPQGFSLTRGGTAERYGKIWLLPYNTGKKPSESHPPAKVWYDDLIISRQEIVGDEIGQRPPTPQNVRAD